MKYSPLYFFGRFCLIWLFRILMPIRIRNAECVPKDGRVIICCNHASNTDPVRLAFAVRRQVYYMAKIELFRNKFVKAVISSLGAFAVDRGRSDKGAINKAQQHLNSGHALGLFIEGTRSKDGSLQRPKSGAAMLAHSCNAPILPCCITSKGGGVPKVFHTCIVSFGKLIQPEELGIIHGTPSELRSASQFVMSRIAELRESGLKEFR